MNKCAYDKERTCDKRCVAYYYWITKDHDETSWSNVKCLRGNIYISKDIIERIS